MAATYSFPVIIRGDTFVGRDIATITQSAVALGVTRAKMELRTAAGELVQTWDTEAATATITGAGSNVVHLLETETDEWPLGRLKYDLEVWFTATGNKLTILRGSMLVEKGTTANA